jgi:redox-sensitive bicupin YhaK (pirin superfamily)
MKTKLSIIAGTFKGIKGKINTQSDLLILSTEIFSEGKLSIPIPEDFNALIYLLDGKLGVNGTEDLTAKQMAIFEKEKASIELVGLEDTRAIILAGKPMEEPVVSYGPFVLSEQQEIHQAIDDYNSGLMGVLNETFNSNLKHKAI